MRLNIDSCVDRLTGPNRHAAVVMFAGAGAGYSVRVAEGLRLPLGNEIRDHLLAQYYAGSTATPQDRVDRFVNDNHCRATPDMVWHSLVQEPHRLATYYPELTRLFGPERPIPSAYYMLARWFFTAHNAGGMATTNFDEKLNAAFMAVANGLGKRLGLDYHVPSVRHDFEYFAEGEIPARQFVQKLHGTLGMPWSIVAGLREGGQIESPAYRMLQKTLSAANHWVFLGYSFQDLELREVIADSYKQRPSASIYVVDRLPSDAFLTVCKTARPKGEVFAVETDVERFLEAMLQRLGQTSEMTTYRLPELERSILQKGPTYISGCAGRMTSRTYQPSPSSFQDPVYGSFKYSDAVEANLIDLIDCGEMQRLRYIKQLSFVHLKHPGATHDRFSHSLGVAHLADRLFQEMRDHPSRIDYGERYLQKESHLSLTVAALFHDTGHGPLGHTMDLVRRRLGIPGGHEQDSLRIFDQGSGGQSFADLDVALRGIPVRRDEVHQILNSAHPLSPILSNPGIDLDRLDFILRDGYNTICSLTDSAIHTEQVQALRRIAQSWPKLLESVVIRGDAGSKRSVIGFAEEVKDLVIDLAQLYTYMYEHVYHCWQNVAAQTMVAVAIEELLRSARYEWLDVIRLTDIELFAALEDFENPKVRELAYLVKYRRLFDCAGEVRFRGSLSATESEVAKILGIGDPAGTAVMDVLPAVIGPKEFRVRFVESASLFPNSEADLGEERVLARTTGRIMFFRWPGKSFTVASVAPQIQSWIEGRGAEFLGVFEDGEAAR